MYSIVMNNFFFFLLLFIIITGNIIIIIIMINNIDFMITAKKENVNWLILAIIKMKVTRRR